MDTSLYDIVGLGNAVIDVIAPSDDDFLVAHGLRKGTMRLIDEATAERLYRAMGQTTIVSGGSAANTIIGAAKLGCRAAFIGKVKADPLGAIFAHDIRAANVAFTALPSEDGPASRSLPRTGHARRAAHDEYLSRRLPAPDPSRCRSLARRRGADHLS